MNEHRKAVVLFAVALTFAIVIASVTTLERGRPMAMPLIAIGCPERPSIFYAAVNTQYGRRGLFN